VEFAGPARDSDAFEIELPAEYEQMGIAKNGESVWGSSGRRRGACSVLLGGPRAALKLQSDGRRAARSENSRMRESQGIGKQRKNEECAPSSVFESGLCGRRFFDLNSFSWKWHP